MIKNQNISDLLNNFISSFIKKDYESIKNKGYFGDLDLSDILNVIGSYPGILTLPSKKELLNFYRYDRGENEAYIEFDLYFDHNQSDLTLCAEVFKRNNEIQMRIQDIRVL
ncbi:MAG: hypothetical protein K2X02_08375 [Alphaproteobacteria bacterium]|nr:hypothetical protein [Alphaproteobacteria bacterium]